jgi:hypothetical protein
MAKARYQVFNAGVKLAGENIKRGVKMKDERMAKLRDEDRHIQELEVRLREERQRGLREKEKEEELEKLREELECKTQEAERRRTRLAEAELEKKEAESARKDLERKLEKAELANSPWRAAKSEKKQTAKPTDNRRKPRITDMLVEKNQNERAAEEDALTKWDRIWEEKWKDSRWSEVPRYVRDVWRRKQKFKEGYVEDWICQICADRCFHNRAKCRTCGEARPRMAMAVEVSAASAAAAARTKASSRSRSRSSR